MAVVEITIDPEIDGGGDPRIVPLAASTIIGRAAHTPWAVDSERMSTHWLEIRWYEPAGWAFRYLGHEELTTARHRRSPDLPEGWYALGLGHCVTHPAAKVKLVDDAAPSPMAVHVTSGESYTDQGLARVVEIRDDGPWPADADVAPPRHDPLHDGEVFAVESSLYRYHDARAPRTTEAPSLDLAGRGVELHLDCTGTDCSLTLTGGLRDITLRSTKLRVLVPYVRERLDGDPDGGWLSVHDVLDDLESQSGSPLRPARIGEYRGWIRYELTRRGVANAAALFEKRRVGGPGHPGEGWLTRIRPGPSQLFLQHS
jgi:hypothetical protein